MKLPSFGLRGLLAGLVVVGGLMAFILFAINPGLLSSVYVVNGSSTPVLTEEGDFLIVQPLPGKTQNILPPGVYLVADIHLSLTGKRIVLKNKAGKVIPLSPSARVELQESAILWPISRHDVNGHEKAEKAYHAQGP